MAKDRVSGVLAHPTSFPSPYGIGDLGPGAFRFVDWMARAGQRRWQLMPLVPTGYGDSPYASPSAFAGNPLLISPDLLVEDGLLQPHELLQHQDFVTGDVEFAQVRGFKEPLLQRAFASFRRGAGAQLRESLASFEATESSWLPDHAVFMSAKEFFGGRAWTEWDLGLAHRDKAELDAFIEIHQHDVRYHSFVQFLFKRQWERLRHYANERGIKIIGDIPIFVAYDSADVWANRGMFRIDAAGELIVRAGVPPDYFSSTGQLWGNPHYDWEALEADGFRWWIDRFRNALALADIVRVDHFRGLAAAWAVPAGAQTSAEGRWERAPGLELFRAIEAALGPLPVIAEDLGLITDDVEDLRRTLGFPGMAVLQFAFGDDPENDYLPHNYEKNSVAYTGTHDNATTIGWFATAPENVVAHLRAYAGHRADDIAWDLLRLAWSSIANTAIAPIQDVFRLGDEARMNRPGTASSNWSWRFTDEQLDGSLADGLASLTALYGRTGQPKAKRGRDPFDYSVDGTRHPMH